MQRRSARQRLVALAGIAVIVGAAVLALWAAGVLGNQGGGEGIENVKLLDPPPVTGGGDLRVSAEKGQVAPDFEISDFDGTRHRLSDFRGRVVYVNFWATWCVPCQAELPDIAELQARHANDLTVITVNRRQPLDTARAFFENLPRLDGGSGVDFAVNGVDPDDTLYDHYRALNMPSSFFIDADGVVSSVVYGQMDLEEMEAAVTRARSGRETSSDGAGAVPGA